MRLLMLISSVLAYALFQSPVFARETKVLTTNEIVAIALKQNPELRAVELETKSLSDKADLGRLWEDPVVEIGAEKNNQPVNAPAGDTNFGKLSISQFIPRPGRLNAKHEGLLALSRMGELEKELSRIELSTQIIKSIYAFKIANERLIGCKERLTRIRTVDTFLHSRSFASPQREAEATITKSRLTLIEKQFRQFEVERATAWNDLNIYLSLTEEPEIRAKWFTKAKSFTVAEILSKAETLNPQIRRQLLKLDYQRTEISTANFDAWPGLTLTASYSDGVGVNPQTSYGLGVSFPIPVLNGNKAAIHTSKIIATAEEARLEWAKLRIRSSVESAVKKLDSSGISITQMALVSSVSNENGMRRINAAFKKGQVELITYLEADAQHFEELNQALESQMEYLNALTEVSTLVGEVPQLPET